MSVSLTSNFLQNARGFTFEDGGGIAWTFNSNTNQLSANGSGAGAGSGNPTAKVGLAAVNGSAGTWMRSDGAPPIDQTIIPTWSGLHTFSGGLTVSGGTVTLGTYTLALSANATVGGTNTGDQVIPAAANPSGSIGLTAVNGSATTWMRSDGAPALSQSVTPTWTGAHTFNAGATFTNSGDAIDVTTTANHYGININAAASSSYALRVVGSGAGNASLILNSQATTGSSTPSWSSNKPGSNSTPVAWLPVLVDGSTGYIPVFS